MKRQWTYGPTLLPWSIHIHTALHLLCNLSSISFESEKALKGSFNVKRQECYINALVWFQESQDIIVTLTSMNVLQWVAWTEVFVMSRSSTCSHARAFLGSLDFCVRQTLMNVWVIRVWNLMYVWMASTITRKPELCHTFITIPLSFWYYLTEAKYASNTCLGCHCAVVRQDDSRW